MRKGSNDRVQCVVVGAGVVGLACARRLSQLGLETLILEKASSCGAGSRHIWLSPSDSSLFKMSQTAYIFLTLLFQELRVETQRSFMQAFIILPAV